MKNSPMEIIMKRTEAYNESDPKTIYSLYSEESEFKQWFPTLKDYEAQFFDLTAVYGSIQTEIISEKVKTRLAEVTYKDIVISKDEELLFYCKGYFALTDTGWKIIREKKEHVK